MFSKHSNSSNRPKHSTRPNEEAKRKKSKLTELSKLVEIVVKIPFPVGTLLLPALASTTSYVFFCFVFDTFTPRYKAIYSLEMLLFPPVIEGNLKEV